MILKELHRSFLGLYDHLTSRHLKSVEQCDCFCQEKPRVETTLSRLSLLSCLSFRRIFFRRTFPRSEETRETLPVLLLLNKPGGGVSDLPKLSVGDPTPKAKAIR